MARVKSKRIETSICSIINIKLSKPIFGLPMICQTFLPVDDFYCHKKCPAIKCVCPVVISAKKNFVRLINQSCHLYIADLNIYTYLI